MLALPRADDAHELLELAALQGEIDVAETLAENIVKRLAFLEVRQGLKKTARQLVSISISIADDGRAWLEPRLHAEADDQQREREIPRRRRGECRNCIADQQASVRRCIRQQHHARQQHGQQEQHGLAQLRSDQPSVGLVGAADREGNGLDLRRSDRVGVQGPGADQPDPALVPPAAQPHVQALVTTGSVGASDALMASMPRLSLICCYGTGYERIDLDAARKRNIMVTHGADANAPDGGFNDADAPDADGPGKSVWITLPL